MALLGCLGVLLVVVLVAVEVVGVWLVGGWLKAWFPTVVGTGYLEALLLQVACWVIGVLLIKRSVIALPMAALAIFTGDGSRAGKLVVAIVAGLLLIVPGLLAAPVAVLMLIPPVPSLLAATATRILKTILIKQFGKMMGKGFPGFPGGFSGGPGGTRPAGFPFGLPGAGGIPPWMTADDQVRRRQPKTYDVKPE